MHDGACNSVGPLRPEAWPSEPSPPPPSEKSGGGRITAAELALAQERLENVGTPHRRETACAICLGDEEHDALLVDQAAVELCQRQEWIVIGRGAATDTRDLDHGKILCPRQIAGRREAQVETPVMEFAHAARNGVDPRLEPRRDMPPGIAPMRIHAEGEREDPAALRAGQRPSETRGFTGVGRETLENQPLAGREMPQVFAQRRNV